MRTITKLPPFVAAFIATPFLVIAKLPPRVFKGKLLFVVVVEYLVSMFDNINLILALVFSLVAAAYDLLNLET